MKHLFSIYAGTLYLVLDPEEKLKKTEVIALFSLSYNTLLLLFFQTFIFLLFIFHARPNVRTAGYTDLSFYWKKPEKKKEREIRISR